MLVSLEGLDGSGKSTVWSALRDAAADSPLADAVFTAEPTDSWYGEAVQRSVADPEADPLAELFLYTADHAAHLSETVRPALSAGRPVVTDRYVDSRYAYQAATLAAADVLPDERDPLDYVRQVHAPWTRHPDLTIFLDVPPAVAAERSDAANKFERRAFLASVRDHYERLLADEPDRFQRIDAERSADAVRADVEAAILDRLA